MVCTANDRERFIEILSPSQSETSESETKEVIIYTVMQYVRIIYDSYKRFERGKRPGCILTTIGNFSDHSKGQMDVPVYYFATS